MKEIPSLSSQNICFYGAGSIAEALIRGLLEQQKALPGHISVLNRQNRTRLVELNDQYGVRIPSSDSDKTAMLQQADIIVLAMKPKDAETGLAYLSSIIHEGQVIVSVIAGLSIETTERILGSRPPIVRTMPNTSSTIGYGATGICFSSQATEAHRALALELFAAIGTTAVVDESQIDLITGVSGSGPAYFYYMMETVIAAAVEGGLDEAMARELTLQTVLGAAQMVKTTAEDPAVLRKKVTSPGGTTQAAIETLESYRFAEAVRKAIFRAAERAGEMGAMIGGVYRD